VNPFLQLITVSLQTIYNNQLHNISTVHGNSSTFEHSNQKKKHASKFCSNKVRIEGKVISTRAL